MFSGVWATPATNRLLAQFPDVLAIVCVMHAEFASCVSSVLFLRPQNSECGRCVACRTDGPCAYWSAGHSAL
jgi:hypothetical protein